MRALVTVFGTSPVSESALERAIGPMGARKSDWASEIDTSRDPVFEDAWVERSGGEVTGLHPSVRHPIRVDWSDWVDEFGPAEPGIVVGDEDGLTIPYDFDLPPSTDGTSVSFALYLTPSAFDPEGWADAETPKSPIVRRFSMQNSRPARAKPR